jgi:GAF domain-containing protein/ActR/RegA family two-component response regulator
MVSRFDMIQRLVEAVNRAPTPELAAQPVVAWLTEHVGPGVAALMVEDATTPHLILNEARAPDALVLSWIRSHTDWENLRQGGETQSSKAVVVPLAHNGHHYGMMWQGFESEADKEQLLDTVLLMAGVLTTRINHLMSIDREGQNDDVVNTLALQTARLSAATSVSKVIISHKDTSAMLYAVTELICHRFGYTSVQVLLLTEDKQALRVEVTYTAAGPAEELNGRVLSLGERSMVGWAVQQDEQVLADDVHKHPFYNDVVDIQPVQSKLALPLRSGTQMLGALAISSAESAAFDEADVEMMQSIADQLAVGLYNARLFTEVRARAQDLAALTEISLLVNATLDVDQLAERVYEAFERLQKPDLFQFVVFDRFSNTLQVETYGDQGRSSQLRDYEPEEDLIAQIINKMTPIFWRNESERETASRFFHVDQSEAASFLGVPMMAKDNVVGVLCSQSGRPNAFDESALQVMLTFANSVAVAIENAELFSYTARRVQELAIINEISSILARSFGDDDFWRLIHRQITSLFEESALYVGVLHPEPDMLQFPLVSMEDMSIVETAPLPISGMSELIMRDGQGYLFDDLLAERSKLDELAVTRLPQEPCYYARSWLGVPLRSANGEVFGLVGIHSQQPSRYDDQDLSLLMTVAAQLSLSLENARLFKSEQQRRSVADTLIDVGRIVASSLQRDEVLQRILEQLQRVVDYDGATIMLNTPNSTRPMDLTIAASSGENSIPTGERIHFGDDSYAMQVYQKRETVIHGDVAEDERWLDISTDADVPTQTATHQVRSWMGVPMMIGSNVIGYIFLNKFEPHFYTEQDAETAFALGQQAAVSVENARLFESEQARRRIADTLIDVGRTVASSLERDEVLEQILEQIQRVVDYDGATVMLQAPGVSDASEMVVYASRGDIRAYPGMHISFNENSFNTKVYHSGQPMVVADVQSSFYFDGLMDHGMTEDMTRAWVCVPMLVQDRFVGFITLDKFEPGYYTERDAETAFALARQAAIAVENARLFESEQERRKIADTLIDVGRTVASTLEPDEVLQTILDQLGRVVNYDSASILLNAPGVEDGSSAILKATRGLDDIPQGGEISFVDSRPNREIYETGRPVIIQDVDQEVQWGATIDGQDFRTKVRSWLGVPMAMGERIIGIISLESRRPHAYSQQEAETAFALARQAAIAVENARLFESEQERRQVADTLIDVGRTVASSLDRDGVLETILEQMQRVVDYDSASILLNAPGVTDGSQAILQAVRGEIPGLQQGDLLTFIPESPNLSIYRSKQPMVIGDVTRRERWELGVKDRLVTIPGNSWIGAPMLIGDRIIGLITLDKAQPNHYTEQDAETAFALARQAAIAVENARLFESEQERRQVADTLIDVGRTVASTLQLEEVLSNILEQMQRVVDYDGATIQLSEPGIETPTPLTLNAIHGAVAIPPGTIMEYQENSHNHQIYNLRRPVILDDVEQSENWTFKIDTPWITTPVRAWMGVPMMVQDRIIGIITLDKFEPGFYSERDADTIFALARQAAVAVENAQLHERQQETLAELRKRARRLASLHRIATVTTSSLDRTRVMSAAASLLQELFGVDSCVMALSDSDHPKHLMLEYPPLASSEPLLFDIGDSQIYSAMLDERGITTISADETEMSDVLQQMLAVADMQTALLAPLIAGDKVIGVIGLDMSTATYTLNVEEQQTYAAIARQVAMAIYNAELYEEALIANRLKSQFLANVSHELRTPLNAIIGYSDMLLTGIYGDLNPKQDDRLSRVNRSGIHLLALISDVLDLSKIEAGQFDLELALLDINQLIRDTTMDITPQVEAKGLSLDVTVSADVPPVEADAGRLRQVLTNLLGNAVKFTSEGFVSLTVESTRVHEGSSDFLDIPPGIEIEDGDWLAITVTDSGIGIALEDQRLIFDAFQQVDGTSRRQYEGTGLGLAIAKQIIEMHGGHMWVESTLDEGSSFFSLLPALVQTSGKPLFEQVSGHNDDPVVLVVDDDLSALQLIQDYLSGDEYRVMCTNNPERALTLAERHRPVAMVLDLMMPTMNGLDVLERIKAQPETSNIPVVILSIVERRSEAAQRGAAEYLTKPVSRDVLLNIISRVARQGTNGAH